MRSRIYGLAALTIIYVAVLALSSGGCASNQSGAASTRPSASAKVYDSLTEVRKAYSLAEDEAVRLHQGKFISDATLLQCRDYLRAARKSIDGAEELLTTHPFDEAKFAFNVASAWQAIQDAGKARK